LLIVSEHAPQKVHSKEQIRAWLLSFGSGALQRSQTSRISSAIDDLPRARRRD
jgi:hypothetical protein